MSVLNQSGEEQVECPLCMEPLEVDDLNFFPCTCGYQICRFCWHRIRLDENGGLCPACRKAYSENPADFIPLSQEQVAKLKSEKRQRDQQRKAKLTESRKHLASVRVVQRNLVFVVGLPVRLADPEILKKHEYFGKFGKIHKVVINQSTAYAGSQGPSASAYVTYMKSDDALRAIQAVNNITIDSRLIKSSLGTTKYCSHFMKNQPCPKVDCMYLHEYGDPEASFTKEQMHAGKHQEYEKKLHEELLARIRQQQQQNATSTTQEGGTSCSGNKAPTAGGSNSSTGNQKKERGEQGGGSSNKDGTSSGGNKENWPTLNVDSKDNNSNGNSKKDKDKSKKGKTKNCNNGDGKKEKKDSCNSNSSSSSSSSSSNSSKNNTEARTTDRLYKSEDKDVWKSESPTCNLSSEPTPSPSPHESLTSTVTTTSTSSCSSLSKLPVNLVDDNTSFFSSNTFQKIGSSVSQQNGDEHSDERADGDTTVQTDRNVTGTPTILTDTLPNIDTTEDWAAAFGFTNRPQQQQQSINSSNSHTVVHQSQHQPPPLTVEQERSGTTIFGHGHDTGFNAFFGIPKVHDNIIDVLSSTKTSNGYSFKQDVTTPSSHIVSPPPQTAMPPPPLQTPHQPTSNGLEHNMSKFFSDFQKYGGKMEQPPTSSPMFPNGFNNLQYSGLQNHILLQQKQLEEQLMNLALKPQQTTNSFGGSSYLNGTPPYHNGEMLLHHNNFGQPQIHHAGNGGLFGTSAPSTQQQQHTKHDSLIGRNATATDEGLDFDPFQETQKALAEMMASEQDRSKVHQQPGRNSQINGIIHNQNGSGHLPPPPPGFLHQHTTPHMNSFGSKILPYLNMSNSQQQIHNTQTQNSWPNSFNSQLSQQQQQSTPQKNLNNTCNDWKVLDPAILSSSRHYQLAQMPPYSSLGLPQPQQQQQQQIPNSSGRIPFDYTNTSSINNSTFSNYTNTTQLHNNQPPNYVNGFATHAQNLNNWFSSELNSQINSPPGFRNNQTSKQQQEC